MNTESPGSESEPGPHQATRARSYKLLEEARSQARERSKYDFQETRRIMAEECRRRTQMTPYPEQLDLAECMLLGLDATCIAGTGWGKTLPFALPLLTPAGKGKVVIIVSPLNSLEADQAERFRKMGLSAVALNAQTNTPELLKDIGSGKYSVVIVGPKLLVGERSPLRVLLSQAQFSKKVLGFIVDEAHCIVQWGGDFRPEYSELSAVRALLPTGASVQAFSATMPPVVLAATQKSLLINPARSFLLNLGNNRRNISWRVVHMHAGKSDLNCLQFLIPDDIASLTRLPKTMVFFDDILQSLKARRWLVNRLPEAFRERVKNYNARMDEESKALVMNGFRAGKVDVLFTTEAAGMGCDIPDIVRIVQYMAPESLSIWMQRAGRAGRSPDIQAIAILLIQPSVFAERNKNKRTDGDPVEYVKELEPGLRTYVDASEDCCRRDVADKYFDNPPGRAAPTGECCDNCTRRAAATQQAQSADCTAEAASLAPRARMTASGQAATMDPQVRFSPANWRAFLQNVKRKDLEAARATTMLQHWRRLTWWKRYSSAPFGASGILADDDIATLSARHTYACLEDLRELNWLLLDEHGSEILAVLALVDMPGALAELNKQRAKYEVEQAEALRRELEKLDAMRQKREREEERERKRHLREKDSRERKERAEVKRIEKERKEAVAPWKKWFTQAAKLARKRFPARMATARPRKRKAAGDEEAAARAAKTARGDEENIPPGTLGAQPSTAVFVGPPPAPNPPRPRPRPRPRPVARSSASTSSPTGLSAGCVSGHIRDSGVPEVASPPGAAAPNVNSSSAAHPMHALQVPPPSWTPSSTFFRPHDSANTYEYMRGYPTSQSAIAPRLVAPSTASFGLFPSLQPQFGSATSRPAFLHQSPSPSLASFGGFKPMVSSVYPLTPVSTLQSPPTPGPTPGPSSLSPSPSLRYHPYSHN